MVTKTKKEKTTQKAKSAEKPKAKAVKKTTAQKPHVVKKPKALEEKKPTRAIKPARKTVKKEEKLHKIIEKPVVVAEKEAERQKPETKPEVHAAVQKPEAPKEALQQKHEVKPKSPVQADKEEVKKEVYRHPPQVEVKKETIQAKEPVVLEPAKQLKELELILPITLKDLSIKLQEKPSALIKMLMGMKMMVGINQVLEEPVVESICAKYGFKVRKALAGEELALSFHQEKDLPEALKARPPIVTLMGHVDHGKTSLLDAIRKTKVAESEHGGITQHIGAYRVHLPNGDISFLDTPGHEAFTAMRARGASITDIVILVVAADDGIMPQTKEAVDHARAAGVSIIVAINKVDKAQADIDRVKKQLSELGLMAEDWGGKTITVPVSAKTGQGIDNLLEMILLESQMLELKANPLRKAKGVVVESKMSKGKGPVATLLIQNGTLHLNESIIAGNCYGKIRAMFNHLGQAVVEAPPAYPVEVLGLSGVAEAGEQFYVVDDEKMARELVETRVEKERQAQIKQAKRINLEDLYAEIKEGKLKELKLVIKADVQGSLEAIKDIINKIGAEEIKLDIIHEGVGNINSSDIILAVASNALVLGFNVVQDDRAKELSSKEGVDVRIYNIIYELANDIKQALEGMLEPKLKRVFLGRAEIRKVFKLSRSGTVAGSFVTKGKLNRQAIIDLVRNGERVFEGKLSSLKRFKDDVREVAEGFECGVTISGFDNLQEGDVIEAYEIEKIARKL